MIRPTITNPPIWQATGPLVAMYCGQMYCGQPRAHLSFGMSARGTMSAISARVHALL